jgi:hypothetical protein
MKTPNKFGSMFFSMGKVLLLTKNYLKKNLMVFGITNHHTWRKKFKNSSYVFNHVQVGSQ